MLVRWDEIKQPLGGAGNINAIAVAEGSSNLIWVGYNNGLVFYTTNGTAGPSPSPTPSWSSGDPNHVLPTSRACTRLTIAPPSQTNDPQVLRKVYVTFGGFSSGNVWKRENDGVTWTDISTGRLPQAPVHSLVVSPSNPDILYIGTEIGVFAQLERRRELVAGSWDACPNTGR